MSKDAGKINKKTTRPLDVNFGSGTINNRCYPYIVCSSKPVGDSNAWSPELNGGRFYEYNGDAGHAKTNATTVRCVLDAEYF